MVSTGSQERMETLKNVAEGSQMPAHSTKALNICRRFERRFLQWSLTLQLFCSAPLGEIV